MTHPYGAPSSLHYENGKKQKTSALNNKKGEKAKSTQKKQKHTYLITDGRTFLTFCPIFGISRISKIRHLVSGRGNPTKKPILPSLKKIYKDTAPAPPPPSTASYIPTQLSKQIDDCTNDDSRPERIHHQQFFNDQR